MNRENSFLMQRLGNRMIDTRAKFDRVPEKEENVYNVVSTSLSYRIGLEGGMIFSREKLNAEYNICPTLENRRMQGGKDIPAKSRLPFPSGDVRSRYEGSTVRRPRRNHRWLLWMHAHPLSRDLCSQLGFCNVTSVIRRIVTRYDGNPIELLFPAVTRMVQDRNLERKNYGI